MNHSKGNWGTDTNVVELAHTNDMEPFWARIKRALHGTFHLIVKNHLNRCMQPVSGKSNIRDWDTLEQMAVMVRTVVGKQIKFSDLTG